ncbi:MAG: ABC transporter permease subunit [bacterium]|nr:ABC transporter permease subunit [bacterium]
MTKVLTPLCRSFGAEVLKLKGTLALWGTLLGPLFLAGMNFLIYFIHEELLIEGGGNPWAVLFGNTFNIWAMMFLPLLMTVIVYLVCNVEHRASAWKHVYALPLPRWSVYITKYLILVFLLFLANGTLVLLQYLTAFLLWKIYPAIAFADFAYDALIMMSFLKVTLASLGMLTIQFVISINVRNFVLPLGLGIFSIIASLFLMRWEHIDLFPYAYAFFAGQDFSAEEMALFTQPVLLGLAVSTVLLLIGTTINSRRDIR